MNNLETIFKKEEFLFPIQFGSDDFKNETDIFLSLYIQDLDNLGIDPIIINKLNKFKKYCLLCLSNYLKGLHSNAYDNFTNAIKTLGIKESPLFSSHLGNEILFRGRINQNTSDFSQNQMFHIPLNKRGLIKTQRYSFPGLPCIYAGTSAYTCWVEMNRPNFEEFQLAIIEHNNGVQDKKIINFSWIPQRLELLENQTWFIESDYYLYWPLLAICSIKVRNEDEFFKPEYIFPQFFLEYILQNKSDYIGIQYVSIKVASNCQAQLEEDWHTYTNYVFPSRSDNMKEEKDEKLSEIFEIGANRSGKELKILTEVIRTDNLRVKVMDQFKKIKIDGTEEYIRELKKRKMITSDKKSFRYFDSVFGSIELALLRKDFNPSSEVDDILVEIDPNDKGFSYI